MFLCFFPPNFCRKSIELKPNSSHLLFRCGKGLINLPPPHQDIKMGLDFIRKGLEISPDSGYGNHAMAMFLDKIEKVCYIIDVNLYAEETWTGY